MKNKTLSWHRIFWFVLVLVSLLLFLNIKGFIVFPKKYTLPLAAVIAVILLITGIITFLVKGKAGKIFASVINILLILCMGAVCIFLPSLESRLRKIFRETEDSEEVRINAYVFTSDYKAEHPEIFKDTANVITSLNLEDYKDALFMIQSRLDQENQAYAVQMMAQVLGIPKLNTYTETDILSAVSGFYNAEAEVLLLNEAYETSIEEIKGYEHFKEDTIILYTITNDVVINKDAAEEEENIDYTTTPFTFFIAGNDTLDSGLHYYGRTDVNILVTVNPNTRQIMIVNIPRDFYVPNPMLNNEPDKLTHLGNSGLRNTITELNELFSMNVRKYFSVNFQTFEAIVDSIGGIDIYNPDTFSFYGIHYFTPGNLHLNGEEALMYCRERYTLPMGDYDRARHQGIVLTAILNKLTSPDIVSHYNELLAALQGQFLTNFKADNIYSLAAMQLNEGGSWDIIKYSMGGEGSYQKVASIGSEEDFYVVIPFESQINFITEQYNRMMNGETITQETIPDADKTTFIYN